MHVNDERVVLRSALYAVNVEHRFVRTGIGAQSVHRFRGKRYRLPLQKEFLGKRERFRVYLANLCLHGLHPVRRQFVRIERRHLVVVILSRGILVGIHVSRFEIVHGVVVRIARWRRILSRLGFARFVG